MATDFEQQLQVRNDIEVICKLKAGFLAVSDGAYNGDAAAGFFVRDGAWAAGARAGSG
ncbi:MAG: hypothetical protein ACKVK3_11425 [Acidimicrobiales bacterium]